jgi:outer membrane protein with beta-barrel domain
MNMKFAAIAALGTLSLAALAPQAAAADNGFYLGGGITQTEFDIEDVSGDDNGFKIIAGFRPLNWLAVEANYIDLGGDEEDGVSVDANATTISALAIAEFGVIDVFAKVGMANWNVDFDVDGIGNFDDDGWEPTYGLGVGAHFGSLGVRAEYEMFNTDLLDELDTDVSTLSLSFTYTFL